MCTAQQAPSFFSLCWPVTSAGMAGGHLLFQLVLFQTNPGYRLAFIISIVRSVMTIPLLFDPLGFRISPP